MKVDVAGLVAAAQKLLGLATSAQGLLAEMAPLAADPTSGGAAARLDMASMQLWGAACAQAYSLHRAAGHLILIAQKFGTQEELNAAGLNVLLPSAVAVDDTTLATLEPVPPIPPDVRVPIPPGATLSGEGFAQLVHTGSAANGVGFSNTATNNAIAIDTAAIAVREVAATVPELWDSPVGTAALAGRLNEHVTALNTIADRWFELAGQSRKHADDYSETVSATPKPQEFTDATNRLNQALAARDQIAASQARTDLGMLEARATAEATRYAGVTETSTSPKGAGAPQAPVGAPGGGAPAAAGAGPIPQATAAPGQAQLAKAGAAEASQAGQAGESAGQLAQMLPSALGAIGGMAGGLAGMAGQVPQALMQTGQGLAQTASQGMSGLASKKATDPELAKSVGNLDHEELAKAKGAGGAGGGGVGDTHPAGALGPAVTPSTSHTVPTVPAGAAPPPTTPAPAGGSAMGGMPMGMPMGGMMPHGQGGDAGADRVAADKKVVTPPQPHTEPVTGKVSDRTAAAAEASRTRADADAGDDDPPRGPVLRRITLAPLDNERT
ncbi:hypothetical protein [Mycolicibacterium stellerae]|uniref:hypothetical protein n=1 Tax=Mycolicibacterium stellerae TaxID=2358193 RepID=UPI000F0BA032|nr:hypothetical protein [Mycolicibacterium stellerae]